MKKLIVATHKSYYFPDEDIYLPLFVGAAGKEDIVNFGSIRLKEDHVFSDPIMRDDTGENISEKNPGFCELTGLYWAWKNLKDADVIGLMHYRRYFTVKSLAFRRGHDPIRAVLTEGELDALLDQYDILVPKKRIYGIETLYSHYAHTLCAKELDEALRVVEHKYPEYAGFVSDVYERRWGYMFNMMIMGREDLEDYCSWLFDILFDLEDRLEKEGYLKGLSPFEARLFGRVSEILFNAWIEKRRYEGYRIGEVTVMSTEPENWGKKGRAFLEAKFRHKKYGESF